MAELSDVELVDNYLKGDNGALEQLVQRYFKQVFLFAKTYVKQDVLAEDATQETFVKVWQNLKKFDPEKKFKTWLFQITKNTCIDILRKNKNILDAGQINEEAMESSLDNLVDERPLPQDLLDSRGFEEKLDQIIRSLPEAYAQTVRLHLQHDLTFQEIADVLNQPINTIKSRYRRALINIQTRLR
ncbi:MAG: sigma-70 family RNA polymerase sigma factor [Candidatus Doudnabacteria bacterium]|nr:sigma-70 family RNA polymerase sigma factor [Candidatus Doudnabacteria bacterium]